MCRSSCVCLFVCEVCASRIHLLFFFLVHLSFVAFIAVRVTRRIPPGSSVRCLFVSLGHKFIEFGDVEPNYPTFGYKCVRASMCV